MVCPLKRVRRVRVREVHSQHLFVLSLYVIEFFTVCTKLAEMAILYSKDLTTAKKVTSSGAQSDTTDYYWFRSPVPKQMS